MRPAKGQPQRAVLHLGHRLVGAVAIDQQHPAGVLGEVFLRHRMAAGGVADIHHRIAAAKDPQPPGVADFAFLVDEDQPARLLALRQDGLPVAFAQGFLDRLEQGLQTP